MHVVAVFRLHRFNSFDFGSALNVFKWIAVAAATAAYVPGIFFFTDCLLLFFFLIGAGPTLTNDSCPIIGFFSCCSTVLSQIRTHREREKLKRSARQWHMLLSSLSYNAPEDLWMNHGADIISCVRFWARLWHAVPEIPLYRLNSKTHFLRRQ